MLKAPVRAVTFDLWDCIFIDDSDEPKRAAAGEKPKPEARRDLLHTFLARHAPIPRETVDLACDITDAARVRTAEKGNAAILEEGEVIPEPPAEATATATPDHEEAPA